MGRSRTDSDIKSHLVTEICHISDRAIACAHQHHFVSTKSPFVDWYLVLEVDENAGIEVIRKHYLKLALQLHPDKNKHPKADIAFKLVSEAYACLSDNERRTAFNLKRERNFCFKCCGNVSDNSPNLSNSKLRRIPTLVERGRSDRTLQRMKDLRARFLEEANIIENCLKANAASRLSNSCRNELPTFNPADYQSKGYPHHTTNNHKKLERSMSKNYVLHMLRMKP